jgi:tripartite-type tricarboxylate transporter receptor subunit TctC
MAQDFPTKPMRIVAPAAPGGSADILARLIAGKLQERFGQPVVVENRAGAGQMIGADVVAKSPGDGHALLLPTVTYTTSVATAAKLPFDPFNDLAGITMIGDGPFLVVVHPSLPVKSVPELIKFVKARPGQLTFSSSGLTGASRLSTELMSNIFGLQMTHVPYKNSHNSIMDVAAGNVQLAFAEAGATQSLIRDGRLRALAVSAQTRLTTFTEIPTMAEASGRPDFEAVSWHALVAPSATPAAVVNRLHGEMGRILKLPEVCDRIVSIGLIPQEPRSIEENRQYIAAETKKWGEVITKLGLAGSQ